MKDVKEAYKDGVIDDIIWIRRKYIQADAMKNTAIISEFMAAIEKNQLQYEVEQ